MRVELEIIAAELKRMQGDGVERVYCAEATAALLEQLSRHVPPPPVRERPPQESRTRRYDEPAPDLVGMLSAMEKETAKKAPARKATRDKPAADTPEIPPAPTIELPGGSAQEQMDWLRERVRGDAFCQQNTKEGCQVVFGVGNAEADIFFCGEAPGEDEELQGEPFVGRAGEKLNGMIRAMGLQREDVFISNILNWRPDNGKKFGNRPPSQQEMAYCMPFIAAQVAIVRPQVIVALGRTAVDGLLGYDPNRRIGKILGQWHAYQGIPVMPAYHPSYLLRNDTMKAKRAQWECLLAVMEKLGLPISDKQRGYFASS